MQGSNDSRISGMAVNVEILGDDSSGALATRPTQRLVMQRRNGNAHCVVKHANNVMNPPDNA